MIRPLLVLLIGSIALFGPPTPDATGPGIAAVAAEDPTKSPAGLEIARLRTEASGEKLERLNAALFFLVRRYPLEPLYAVVKGETPDWIIARGEVEQHLDRLQRARLALRLRYKSDDAVRNVTMGLSEREIIALAESPQ